MKSIYIKILVILLFILSGICGLIYEVAWSKYLATFIGSTAYSHMIVLATYMGGLALGAYYWGKRSDKISNRLWLYGILELGIGVYCLAYPFIIEHIGNLFISTVSSFDGELSRVGILSLKFLLSFITIILPTFLMGGTLPILSKFFTKNINNSGKDVAILYYINSFGAVIGTGLAGFYLIRIYGVENTVLFAALFNILIGLAAIIFSKFVNDESKAKEASKTLEIPKEKIYSKTAIQIAIYTALASGFIAMLYELAWIRLLSNILGSTTYSFTLMLVAFISGIAIGSLIVSFLIKKIKNLLGFLAICQVGTALSMILMLPLYERLPYYLMKISAHLSNTPDNFSTFLRIEFLFCFAIMLIPTIFSGMSLPVASRIANNDIRFVGKTIGGIFSVNTIGSVIGALITGLVLIPLLGIKSTLELGVILNAIVGIIILFNSGVSKRIKAIFIITFILLALVYKILFPNWNQNFLISGVFRTLYTQEVTSYSEFKNMQNEGQRILWHKEGVNANVAVRESHFGDTIQRTLVINGKADASSVADLNTQVLLGQIPLMLSSNNGDALVIGLGSGITCGTALKHPIKSLDVVEIASEVVECNYLFKEDNHNFMADPRTKIYVDDAITYLKTSSKKYDYIISEPSNPWIAGIGNLYSFEFFNICKERMNANGVLSQWFHTYDVNNDIFRLVLSTITKVFPNVTIWKVSDADVIILASVSPLAIDFNAMKLKFKEPQIAKELSRVKMYDLPALLSTQIVSSRNNPYHFSQKEVNSINKSPLEFLAPVALFTHESVSVLDSLDERFSFKDKNLWISDYMKQQSLEFENYMNIARYRNNNEIGDYSIAYTSLKKALEINPNNKEVLAMLSQVTSALRIPDVNTRNAQLEEYQFYYDMNPTDFSSIFNYLNVLIDYYRIENSIVNPQNMDNAILLMNNVIKNTQGQDEKCQYIKAMVLTGAGRYEEAVEAFETLIQLQNSSGVSIISNNEIKYNIGESYFNAGNLSEAEKYFANLKTIGAANLDINLFLKKIELKKKGIR